MAYLTGARRHLPHVPSAHQDRRPQLRHRQLSEAAKEIQIAHNQRTVKPRQLVRPLTHTVTSCWWQVLEGVTATQIMYVDLDENSPTIPANTPELEGYIIFLEAMHKVFEGELNAITQPTVLFSHTDELKFWSSSMPRPTRRKTTKTMAPRSRSTSSLPRRTHPRKTHCSPQPSLHYAHASRPYTALFKR